MYVLALFGAKEQIIGWATGGARISQRRQTIVLTLRPWTRLVAVSQIYRSGESCARAGLEAMHHQSRWCGRASKRIVGFEL